ncbi:TPA: hypothetical protein ACGYSL_002807 [Legionella pneumophila]
MLKGQDIAILIKLLLKNNTKEKIEFKSIAHELYISQSEVTKSIIKTRDYEAFNALFE